MSYRRAAKPKKRGQHASSPLSLNGSKTNQPQTLSIHLRSAGGAAGNPITGAEMKHFGIPNTFSLAWRLGRAVVAAKSRPRAWSFADVARSIIAECGGPGCCRVVFRGKMRGVESRITTTAHSIGQVTIEKVDEEDDDDGLYDGEDAGSITEVKVPFMNENLSVIGRKADGTEKVRCRRGQFFTWGFHSGTTY